MTATLALTDQISHRVWSEPAIEHRRLSPLLNPMASDPVPAVAAWLRGTQDTPEDDLAAAGTHFPGLDGDVPNRGSRGIPRQRRRGLGRVSMAWTLPPGRPPKLDRCPELTPEASGVAGDQRSPGAAPRPLALAAAAPGAARRAAVPKVSGQLRDLLSM